MFECQACHRTREASLFSFSSQNGKELVSRAHLFKCAQRSGLLENPLVGVGGDELQPNFD